MNPMRDFVVLIKGAGDLGTGVAMRLHRSGLQVVMTDIPAPLVVRRTVSFAEAIPLGECTVEGITAVRADGAAECRAALSRGCIPVVADPECAIRHDLNPEVLVDAIMAKRNTGTHLTDAPLVVAIGPGFEAGRDCHVIVETKRGHTLGRTIYSGSAAPDTGIPGAMGGVTWERLLRAPASGTFYARAHLGEMIAAGQTVGVIGPGEVPVVTVIGGLLRGLLRDGAAVTAGVKVGDVDPTGEVDRMDLVSDKALAIGGGVLEGILHFVISTSHQADVF
jgi:xanthine dehydrogenase accessory factor